MELLTERVPTRRVLHGDDGAPLDGDCVLAIATRWDDRPLSLTHLKRGVPSTPMEGLEVRWEGGLPVIATTGGIKAFLERPGVATVESGRRTALELGDVFFAQLGALTLEARLQRKSERSPSVRRQEGFFFALVVTHSLMLMTALLVAMVITPFTPDESMWGSPSKLHVPITPQVVLPKARAPELDKKIDEAVRTATTTPRIKTPQKATAVSVLQKLFAGGGGGGVFSGGLRNIDAALDSLRPGVNGVDNGLVGLTARDTGGGLGPGNGLSLGRIGPPGGPGKGPGVGLRGKRIEDIVCANCVPKLAPGYDRDLVLKVVRRHQSEIRYCYETELAKEPTLGGKVTVAWTIGATGTVDFAEIAESGLGNSRVESCIVQRIKRWNFPEPTGGQEVAITFPWVFHVAGADE